MKSSELLDSIRIEKIHLPEFRLAGVTVDMARADKIHPLASGNKWFKLKPQLDLVKTKSISEIISFGGAYSNHIHALALLAKHNGISTRGIIRGESASKENPTLTDALQAGMQLEFVSRQDYKKRNEPEYLKHLKERFPEALIVPEGGMSKLAIQGCKRLLDLINLQSLPDYILTASGTGTTLAGIVLGLKKHQKAIGYLVLKDPSVVARVSDLVKSFPEHELDSNHGKYSFVQADFGGYAKLDHDLFQFILYFLDQTGVLLDPIYTSKMCFKLMQQIQKGVFEQGAHIVIIHSGGLQGWRGMKPKIIKKFGINDWNTIETALMSE